eukprot:Gb_11895 [translate_table: standard]
MIWNQRSVANLVQCVWNSRGSVVARQQIWGIHGIHFLNVLVKGSGLATPRLSEDKVKQCVDSRLKGDYPPKAVAKMAAVAALCVQYEADFRPNMSIVVKALQPLLNTRSVPAGGSPAL